MVFDRVSDIIFDDVFLRLDGFLPHAEVLVKLEGLNCAGSIKLKTAKRLIHELEAIGRLGPGHTVIESSSGNLGVALSIVCAERGYPFICVCDPNSLSGHLQFMKAYGASVVVVTQRDANGGYLNSRIDYIRERLAEHPTFVWPNQYANPANSHAHRDWTADGILTAVPQVHSIFIAAGTTGTLMGVIEAVTERAPHVQVFAVDVKGSVTFGFPAGNRFIPGAGTSRRPELFDPTAPMEPVVITEKTTVRMNRELLARWKFLAGGSTGTVLVAVRALAHRIPPGSTVVAISPDFGEGYLDTIYNDDWVEARFPGALQLSRRSVVS